MENEKKEVSVNYEGDTTTIQVDDKYIELSNADVSFVVQSILNNKGIDFIRIK